MGMSEARLEEIETAYQSTHTNTTSGDIEATVKMAHITKPEEFLVLGVLVGGAKAVHYFKHQIEEQIAEFMASQRGEHEETPKFPKEFRVIRAD